MTRGLSALDLYGPYRLFRLHALCEALLFAAALQMAIGFPRPLLRAAPRRTLLGVAWAAAAALGVVYQYGLPQPGSYVTWHLLATCAGGAALLVLVVSQLARMAHLRWSGVPHPAPSVVLGTVAALLLPVAITTLEPWTGGTSSQNLVAFTVFLFPMSIGYSAFRERLLEP